MKALILSTILITVALNARAEENNLELQHFWMSPGEQLALEQIEIHARDTGLNIETFENQNYNRLRENISERLSLGYLPEATHWIAGEDLSILAESETLLPLPASINGKPLTSILHPEVFNAIQINGESIALPVGIHLQSSAVYNKKTLAKIGQSSIPSDWETFFENAEKLDAAGILPLAVTDEFWVLREMFYAILLSFGQKQSMLDLYIDFDKSGFFKKQLLQTFEVLFKLKKYADAEHEGRGWAETVKLVIDGKAAAVFIGDFARSEIAFYGKDNLRDYECAGLPGLQNAHFQIDIFVLFNNKNPTWKDYYPKFVASVLSPESQSDYLYFKGGIPVIKGVEPSTLNQCSQASLKRWNDNPDQRFVSLQRNQEPLTVIHELLPKIWESNDMTPEEATELLYNSLKPDVGS